MSRVVLIVTLVIAGEMIFGLPFHTARFFRPTLLDVFGFTNTQLGDLFAVYGTTAMLAYFPGGALADRFSARFLLTASLVATAIGGLYMATIPGAMPMAALYGYWGITTIFLFWGALIRATRDWGGTNAQGMAFGTLEAGRGLVAAGVASICVWIFAGLMPDVASIASDQERRAAFQTVILSYSLVTLAAGALTWVLVPVPEYNTKRRPNPLTGMAIVFRRPIVWAQAAVIVCAYCCYKGLDNYALYAVQVLGMNEIDAARFATWGAYLRPIAAITAGLVADRFDAAKTIGILFFVLLLSYAPLSFLAVDGFELTMIYVNIFVSFFAVFALRGIYFALLEENKTPVNVTGAAVGMVSLVGYTPEIFFAPIAGRILDATPGIGGHQNYFLFLAIIAAAGMLVVGWLLWLQSRGLDTLWPSSHSGRASIEINT
ncbi:MAG: MFS transporter [Gammaproteobacteria bacterium]|nr:MFS transporter [Gammaproteobacteria bacterium]